MSWENWTKAIGENIIQECSLKIGETTRQIYINKKRFDVKYRHLKKQTYDDIHKVVSDVMQNYNKCLSFEMVKWSECISDLIKEMCGYICHNYITHAYNDFLEYVICYENIVVIINYYRIEYIFNDRIIKKSDLEDLKNTFLFLSQK